MSAPAVNVGDTVVHYWRYAHGGALREVLRTKIVRETPTQWVDASGGRWRKKDGRSVEASYGPELRYIMLEAEFDAKAGAR